MSRESEQLSRIAHMLERIAVALEAWSIPTPPKEPVRQMPTYEELEAAASEASITKLPERRLLADGWMVGDNG